MCRHKFAHTGTPGFVGVRARELSLVAGRSQLERLRQRAVSGDGHCDSTTLQLLASARAAWASTVGLSPSQRLLALYAAMSPKLRSVPHDQYARALADRASATPLTRSVAFSSTMRSALSVRLRTLMTLIAVELTTACAEHRQKADASARRVVSYVASNLAQRPNTNTTVVVMVGRPPRSGRRAGVQAPRVPVPLRKATTLASKWPGVVVLESDEHWSTFTDPLFVLFAQSPDEAMSLEPRFVESVAAYVRKQCPGVVQSYKNRTFDGDEGDYRLVRVAVGCVSRRN